MRPFVYILVAIAVLGCEQNVKTFTDDDRLAMHDLRGDWTGRSNSNPACQRRWILATGHGDFEEDCEVSAKEIRGEHVVVLWTVSGTNIDVTHLVGRAAEVKFVIERKEKNLFVVRDPADGSLWTFRRTGF